MFGVVDHFQVIGQPAVPAPMAEANAQIAWWRATDGTFWSANLDGTGEPTAFPQAGVVSFQVISGGQVAGILQAPGDVLSVYSSTAAGGPNAILNRVVDVTAFQLISSTQFYALKTDGSLWEYPESKGTQVKSDIAAFQAFPSGAGDALILLDTSGYLSGPGGQQHAGVSAVQAVDEYNLLFSTGDLSQATGELSLGSPNGTQTIAKRVAAFAAILVAGGVPGDESIVVYWIDNEGDLFALNTSSVGNAAQVDGHAIAMAASATDPSNLLVMGSDGNLWYEHQQAGSWGEVPPPRGLGHGPVPHASARAFPTKAKTLTALPASSGG